MHVSRPAAWLAALAIVGRTAPAAAAFVNFESQQVRPLALTPDGTRLLAVNTPDNRLSVFQVSGSGLQLLREIPVGLEPVSVAAENDTRAWVANHVSDTVSLVDLLSGNVVETLSCGDEPTDIVFAGSPRRAFVCVSQEDAVKIFDPANLQAPPVVVPIFGSDPRALAVSPDGTKVYAAVFESGNNTTIAGEQDVVAHGGLPAPNPPGRPNTGLVLRRASGTWTDELGRNFNDTHPYTLPDHDVAVLDANAPVPVPAYLDGLGTLHFGIGVHPVTGKVYTTHTEALNHVRFEPNLRGRFLRTRLAIVDPALPASPALVDLNPHIDYGVTPGQPSEIALSLAQPGAMVFDATGSTLYVAVLGSAMVAVLDEAGTVLDRIPVGQGPTGVVLHPTHPHLYVLERFDNTITVLDTGTRAAVQTLAAGYDPSPPAVRLGRKFLYDGRISSGHGDLSCASCHAGGNFDNIAWDLGDPNGSLQPPPPNQLDPLLTNFHPMKGPMTTQSLRGLSGTQPFHWRGDRPDFTSFNGAFVSLMGRAAPLAPADMQAFSDFILTVQYAPNPNQNLDRSFPNPSTGPSPERGRIAFQGTPLDGPFRCADCHTLPAGTNGLLVNRFALQESQDMKVPHLRNLYEKTGFELTPGEKKRGFGFIHDGSVPTLFDFLRLPVFSFGSNDALRRDVEAFILAFDTGMAPAVGAQRTVHAGNKSSPATIAWIDLMTAQDAAGNCDLVVKGVQGGAARGWVYSGGDLFRSDRDSEPLVDATALRNLAGAGAELTYTGVPPGCGTRIGIDRDQDGYGDRTEIDAGSDPADPLSTPGTTAVGPDGGGGLGVQLLAGFPNPAPAGAATIAFEIASRERVRLRIFDARGRAVATLHDGPAGPGRVSVRWDGTGARGQRVASGKYFCRLEFPGGVQVQPLLVVR